MICGALCQEILASYAQVNRSASRNLEVPRLISRNFELEVGRVCKMETHD